MWPGTGHCELLISPAVPSLLLFFGTLWCTASMERLQTGQIFLIKPQAITSQKASHKGTGVAREYGLGWPGLGEEAR